MERERESEKEQARKHPQSIINTEAAHRNTTVHNIHRICTHQFITKPAPLSIWEYILSTFSGFNLISF